MYLFESLETYNTMVALATKVKAGSDSFPKSTFYFVKKLNLLVDSIYHHFAKAHAHYRKEDRKNYFWMTRGAINECAGLIEIASKQGLFSFDLRNSYLRTLDELDKSVKDLIRNEVGEGKAIPTRLPSPLYRHTNGFSFCSYIGCWKRSSHEFLSS